MSISGKFLVLNSFIDRICQSKHHDISSLDVVSDAAANNSRILHASTLRCTMREKRVRREYEIVCGSNSTKAEPLTLENVN